MYNRFLEAIRALTYRNSRYGLNGSWLVVCKGHFGIILVGPWVIAGRT